MYVYVCMHIYVEYVFVYECMYGMCMVCIGIIREYDYCIT